MTDFIKEIETLENERDGLQDSIQYSMEILNDVNLKIEKLEQQRKTTILEARINV